MLISISVDDSSSNFKADDHETNFEDIFNNFMVICFTGFVFTLGGVHEKHFVDLN